MRALPGSIKNTAILKRVKSSLVETGFEQYSEQICIRSCSFNYSTEQKSLPIITASSENLLRTIDFKNGDTTSLKVSTGGTKEKTAT